MVAEKFWGEAINCWSKLITLLHNKYKGTKAFLSMIFKSNECITANNIKENKQLLNDAIVEMVSRYIH